MYVRTYVRTYACMHGCMHACRHACMHACMCLCVCVSVRVCFWVPVYSPHTQPFSLESRQEAPAFASASFFWFSLASFACAFLASLFLYSGTLLCHCCRTFCQAAHLSRRMLSVSGMVSTDYRLQWCSFRVGISTEGKKKTNDKSHRPQFSTQQQVYAALLTPILNTTNSFPQTPQSQGNAILQIHSQAASTYRNGD